MLLHFGHFGSCSDSITYIKQRGHPTSIIVAASGLFEYDLAASDDTHELGGEVGDTVADRFGDSTPLFPPPLGGDRFSFSSSFGAPPSLLFLRFIFKLSAKNSNGFFVKSGISRTGTLR